MMHVSAPAARRTRGYIDCQGELSALATGPGRPALSEGSPPRRGAVAYKLRHRCKHDLPGPQPR